MHRVLVPVLVGIAAAAGGGTMPTNASSDAERPHRCPGGSLEACIKKCPAAVYNECGKVCDERCPEAPALQTDTTLYVEPFYNLADPTNDTAATIFRQAYCQARQIAYKEDFTLLFNTAVYPGRSDIDGGNFLTRESFKDGASFKIHIKNVAIAFANALGVAYPTGFTFWGSKSYLDTLADDIQKFKATSFVTDAKSFRKKELDRRQDYFAIDAYLTLNSPEALGDFQGYWREARDLATTQTGILSFGMGVHVSDDGQVVQIALKETYVDASAYKAWLPKVNSIVGKLFSVSRLSSRPNPFSMIGHRMDLMGTEPICESFNDKGGCIQYEIDNCTNVAAASSLLLV